MIRSCHINTTRIATILVTLLMVTSATFGTGAVLAAEDTDTTPTATGQDVNVLGDHESKTASSAAVCKGGLDIVFTFDTTGSMGEEIDGAKDGITDFISNVEDSGSTARYGLVGFNDETTIKQDLTSSESEITSAVDGLFASGGGDFEEDSWDALNTSIEDLDRDKSNRLVVVHITDAISHGANRSDSSRRELATKFNERNIEYILAGTEDVKEGEFVGLSTASSQSSGDSEETVNSTSFHWDPDPYEQDLYEFATDDVRDSTYVSLEGERDEFSRVLTEEISTDVVESCAPNFDLDDTVAPNVTTDEPLRVTTTVENIGEESGIQDVSAVFEGNRTTESSSKTDVAFVFDDTGSMGGEIEGAQESLKSFAEKIGGPDSETRYSLVRFDDSNTIAQNYTSDVDEIQGALDDLTASGGADFEEDSYDAIDTALTDLEEREDARTVIVHVTDAAAHTTPRSNISQSALAEKINFEGAKYILAGPTSEDLEFTPVAGRPTEVVDLAERSAFIDLGSGDFSDLLTDEIATEVTKLTTTATETVRLGVGDAKDITLETERSGFATGEYNVTVSTENTTESTSLYVVDRSDATIESVTRDINRTSVTNGSTVTVETTASFNGTVSEAELTSGVVPAVNRSNVTVTDSGTASSVDITAGRSNTSLVATYTDTDTATLTYQLTIPETAAVGTTYDIGGTVTTPDELQPITGDSTIEVVAGEAEESDPSTSGIDTATRDIERTELPDGSTTRVTIDITFNGTSETVVTDKIAPKLRGKNVEIVAAGSGSEFATYVEDAGEIYAQYSGVGSTELVYEVTVPESALPGTTYELSGEDISGEDTITVSASSAVESADRTISSAEAAPGETVEVSIDATIDEAAVSNRVDDLIVPAPGGENVTVVEDDGATVSAYQESTGIVTANYPESKTDVTLKYEFTIPETASEGDTYNFAASDITGADTVTVVSGSSDGDFTVDDVGFYADEETGVVGPSGLGDAASNFRTGEIGPTTLGEVAAAFRSGKPV